jgi:hypothetical protein
MLASLTLAIANISVYAADGDVIVQSALSGAALNGMRPSGVAEFRSNADGSRRFKVEVEDVNLPAGTVLGVFVDGAGIGNITLTSLREGELERNTNDGQAVPNVHSGTTVAVRLQSGATLVSGAFGDFSTGTPPPPPPPGSPGDERYTARFSSANYNVAENGGSVEITITRTGDISREAKVDYATSDGTASARSDYTVAYGRLRFAAGEASKSFPLLVTDDGLVEGSETVHVRIVEASNSGTIGAPGSAVVFISDNDTTASATNPLDSTTFFVRQHYLDFLNREPDPAGLAGWSSILEHCSDQGFNDDSCDRIHVSSGFYRSPEFQDRGYFIYRFYETALGRRPTFAEFVPDMARVNGYQTDAEKEANKVAFIDEFMARAEFRGRYDQLTTAGAYVDALLQTVGVTLANRDDLVRDLAEGRKTRAQVLREIVESQQVYTKLYNRAFVAMEYFGYLRRDPDATGYDYWVNYLDATGDYRHLVHGFVDSPENRRRFGEH